MTDSLSTSLPELLEKAIAQREPMIDLRHETALRLFNGFIEGNPELCIDLYAKTIVFHNYANPPEKGQEGIQEALQFLKSRLPWIKAGERALRRIER
jgi:23S rRNA (cytosine1962-C5)-methyltransferase